MEESRRSLWTDYVSMKALYSWLPDEEKLVSDIGISMEDAKKISDEKVWTDNQRIFYYHICSDSHGYRNLCF